jgi:hypothetical protein
LHGKQALGDRDWIGQRLPGKALRGKALGENGCAI